MEPEQKKKETHEEPDIHLVLELEAGLFHLLNRDASMMTAVRSTVEQQTAAFIGTMGIPGVPRLEITALAEPAQQTTDSEDNRSSEQFLRFSVNGQECTCPADLLRSVYCYIISSLLLVEATSAYILSWLYQCLGDAEDVERDEQVGRAVEFLGLACIEMLKIRPSILLTLPQVATYCGLLAAAGEGQNTTPDQKLPQADWLLPILRTVLDMHLSIANPLTVGVALSYVAVSEASPEDTGEELIAYLEAQTIEIQVSRDYLKEVTIGDAGQDRFITLRKELFDEFGIRYPDFHFVAAEHLKPGCFAFKLNALTTLPFVGLKARQGLLSPPAPYIDDEALKIINPLSGEVESLVELEPKPEDLRYRIARKQLDYLLICFKATLKKHRALFVHQSFVTNQCKTLKRENAPGLVNALKAKMSEGQLTRILRLLVLEGDSIRNMHFLFERLLDFLYMSADPEQNSMLIYWMTAPLEEQKWINAPENAVSFLKDSLKRADILPV